ncbi:hypothetical protein DVH26_32635 [Paenibacillus sp. H1-7]|uniref:DUF6171 family protein n=1 Tax=Paenibacillus sp. H1-7 TaxID=2282849 RepID=UPI001EF7B46B|nr:DUF6171 family protein [Paenibacillus sp. H1-7]ULL18769.1 hypothetical protein DVH26_32635 [Paenibacillus sp. H1-7]
MATPPCRGCPGAMEVTAEQIVRLTDVVRRTPSDCVPDDVYEQRLVRCRECESLLDSHTCRHCGCFVQVRALLKERGCPYPGGSRWAV